MSKPEFKFDRTKQTLQATRDFDHGAVQGKKDEPVSDADLATLVDADVKRLVQVAKVAKLVDRKAGGTDKK